MSILTDYLKQNDFQVTKGINTNNDWGFGGAIKDVYIKSDISVTIGRACYRHTPSTKFIRINKPNCIFDEFDTTIQRKKAISILTDLITT